MRLLSLRSSLYILYNVWSNQKTRIYISITSNILFIILSVDISSPKYTSSGRRQATVWLTDAASVRVGAEVGRLWSVLRGRRPDCVSRVTTPRGSGRRRGKHYAAAFFRATDEDCVSQSLRSIPILSQVSSVITWSWWARFLIVIW